MHLALPMGHFQLYFEDIYNQSFEVLCQERVQYYDGPGKKAWTPPMFCKSTFRHYCNIQFKYWEYCWFILRAINATIKWFPRDVVPKYCHDIEFSAFYTVRPGLVKSLTGPLYYSLPLLLLHKNGEEIIPIVLVSDTNNRLWDAIACTLTWLQPYEMFESLLIIRLINCLGLQRIHIFLLQRDVFLY